MKTCRQWICATVAVVLGLFGFAASARADGLIIIDKPTPELMTPGHFTFAPLEVRYHRVDVKIDGNVAVTSVDQEFYNPSNQRLEGTYLFPLPDGAHIDKFSMDVNGKMTDAELLPADKARSLYEEIVRKSRDPALLEYVGRGAFRVRIFPIEPNAPKQVKISYTQILKDESGLTEYTYPLNTEKFSSRPLKDLSVKVSISCKEPLKSVYCPSHSAEVKRDGESKAVIGFEQKDVRPDTDFKVIYSRSKNPVGIDLLTYRNAPDKGYFCLMASPGAGGVSSQVQAKDVCFVIDTSGSMAGAKMEQARKALTFCLANLNESDRFEIVRFSTEAENLFGELQPADRAHLDKAQAFVNQMKPIGGTAINDALQKSLTLKGRSERPYVVIFLTDGQPTIGEMKEDAIVANASKAAAGTRIFSFGIGTDINTHLLDRIAAETKSFSQYVLPEEDIEVKVSSFYTKIREPVLSGVEVAVESAIRGRPAIRLTQVYPNVMPDLYKGETLMVFGRYEGSGTALVKITGTINGERKEFVTSVSFADQNLSQPFIPRLWATRRVGWLLDEIRLRGESAELKDEVVTLAREHGIVTPYTAYLILEDEQVRNVPIALRNFRELEQDRVALGRASGAYGVSRGGSKELKKDGETAVANARFYDQMKQGQNAAATGSGYKLNKSIGPDFAIAADINPSRPTTQPAGYRVATNYEQQAKVVNGRAFYQNGTVWTDSTAQAKSNAKRQEVAFNSDEYFTLLKRYPDAAQWLSLGTEVDVVLDDVLYVVR